jgi:hypothetical protein
MQEIALFGLSTCKPALLSKACVVAYLRSRVGSRGLFARYLVSISATLSHIFYHIFSWISSSTPNKWGDSTLACHDRLLPNPLYFIIHQSLHHSTPWNDNLRAMFNSTKETPCSLVVGYKLYGVKYIKNSQTCSEGRCWIFLRLYLPTNHTTRRHYPE